MCRKVTGVIIDIQRGYFGECVLDGTLEGYYEALGCGCFDIAYMDIGGERFAVYCDDEGLLKEAPRVSACTAKGEARLVGNLFIAKIDEEGETQSLTSSEIELVNSRIRIGMFKEKDGLEIRPFLLVE